jgi:cobalamin biosynthesis protein CobT
VQETKWKENVLEEEGQRDEPSNKRKRDAKQKRPKRAEKDAEEDEEEAEEGEENEDEEAEADVAEDLEEETDWKPLKKVHHIFFFLLYTGITLLPDASPGEAADRRRRIQGTCYLQIILFYLYRILLRLLHL